MTEGFLKRHLLSNVINYRGLIMSGKTSVIESQSPSSILNEILGHKVELSKYQKTKAWIFLRFEKLLLTVLLISLMVIFWIQSLDSNLSDLIDNILMIIFIVLCVVAMVFIFAGGTVLKFKAKRKYGAIKFNMISPLTLKRINDYSEIDALVTSHQVIDFDALLQETNFSYAEYQQLHTEKTPLLYQGYKAHVLDFVQRYEYKEQFLTGLVIISKKDSLDDIFYGKADLFASVGWTFGQIPMWAGDLVAIGSINKIPIFLHRDDFIRTTSTP